MSAFDKLCDFVHDIYFYLDYERPIRKLLNEFNEEMDKAIELLEDVRDSEYCQTANELRLVLKTDCNRIVIKEPLFTKVNNSVQAAFNEMSPASREFPIYNKIYDADGIKWYALPHNIIKDDNGNLYELITNVESQIIVLLRDKS